MKIIKAQFIMYIICLLATNSVLAQSQLIISNFPSGILCEGDVFSVVVKRGTFPTSFSSSSVIISWEINGSTKTSNSSTKNVFEAEGENIWDGKKLKCTVTDGINTASIETNALKILAKPLLTSNPNDVHVVSG